MTRPLCSIHICEDRAISLGWCSRHYQRYRKHGDPLVGEDTIRAKVINRAPNGSGAAWIAKILNYKGNECRYFPFDVSRGYRRTGWKGREQYVHRVVCSEVHGRAPTKAHEVAHSCGNGHLGCATPSHLRWATSKENKADQVIHGTDHRGEKHWNSELSVKDVHRIRRKYNRNAVTQAALAKEYAVARSVITRIINYTRWKHV